MPMDEARKSFACGAEHLARPILERLEMARLLDQRVNTRAELHDRVACKELRQHEGAVGAQSGQLRVMSVGAGVHARRKLEVLQRASGTVLEEALEIRVRLVADSRRHVRSSAGNGIGGTREQRPNAHDDHVALHRSARVQRVA
jgi:hypothetical protein